MRLMRLGNRATWEVRSGDGLTIYTGSLRTCLAFADNWTARLSATATVQRRAASHAGFSFARITLGVSHD